MPWRCWLIVVLGLRGVGPPSTSHEVPQRFVVLAEGFSSMAPGRSIEAGYRLHTATSLTESCPGFAGVRRLRSVDGVPGLEVGREFHLSSLHVDAQDDRGRVVPHVPIFLEVSEAGEEVLRLRSDDVGQSFGVYIPVHPGAFTIRIRLICTSGPPLDLPVRVSP